MPTATIAWVAGAGAHAAPKASTARKIGEKILEWQVSQGCQRIPTRNSHNEKEKKLAKSFQDVLRRRYGAIGEKLCQQQLSADEIHFINRIPGVHSGDCAVHTNLQTKRRLSSSDLVDLQTWQRTPFRPACDQIWQFRLANAGAKPNWKSDNAEEASLGRLLARVLIRVCRRKKQLSSGDVVYLRNTLNKPISTETTNSIARSADELHFINGIHGVHYRGLSLIHI